MSAPTDAASARPGGALRADGRFMAAVLLAGLLARVLVWWLKGGFHYPDEMFQYLEPANLKLTGLAWLPWEYDRGVRSWLLPGYYGGLMWWLRLLPIDGFTIHRILCLHNALWSLLLIPAVWRLARAFAGLPAARTAAILAALYPPILFYMPHTLNEVPGLLLTTWGLVWWAESRFPAAAPPSGAGPTRAPHAWRGPFLAGIALCAAAVVRPTLVLWAVVPGLDWLLRGRFRALGWLLLGALVPLAVSGVVDWITWGAPFHSTIEYVRYNLIESGASDHGVSPWDFYLEEWLWARMGIGLVVCGALALLWLPRTALLLVAAAIPVAALSAIAHKEERFLLSSYPLILVAGAIGLERAFVWMRRRPLQLGLASACLAAVLTTGLLGSRGLDWRWRAGIFAGQAYVGHQPDATGVLLDDRIHLNGGYLVLDRHIPELPFARDLARHGLFRYLVLETGSPEAAWAEEHGFQAVASFDEATVYRRDAESGETASGRRPRAPAEE